MCPLALQIGILVWTLWKSENNPPSFEVLQKQTNKKKQLHTYKSIALTIALNTLYVLSVLVLNHKCYVKLPNFPMFQKFGELKWRMKANGCRDGYISGYRNELIFRFTSLCIQSSLYETQQTFLIFIVSAGLMK